MLKRSLRSLPQTLRDHTITALIICVALIARLWNLGGRSLSYDEGFSLHFSTLPLATILTNTQETNPPLYYGLLHVWMLLFGDSEFSLRLLSALFGVAAVLLTGWVGRLIGGRPLARVSMALLAIMPLAVEQSQIARTYSGFLAVTLASYGCLLQWETSRRTRWAVAYALTTILMCYAHNYAVFNLIAQHAYLAWQVSQRKISLREWASVLVPVCVGYLPWSLVIIQQLHAAHAGGFWLPRPSLLALLYTPHFYVTRYLAPELVWAYIAVAGFGLTRLAGPRRREVLRHRANTRRPLVWSTLLARRRTDGLLLLWLACPTLLPFLWSRLNTPIFWPRYTIAASPAFALLVSQGLLGLTNRHIRTLTTSLLIGVTATSLFSYHAQPSEQWRALTETVQSLVHPGDALTVSDVGAQWVFRYYVRESLAFHPLPATVPPDQQHAIREALQRIVAGRHRLWMVLYPEPFYAGRPINEVFAEQSPNTTLFYFKEFPGSPGALYVFGYAVGSPVRK